MRIAYGVGSEGMGHATRSQAVIDLMLSHGHEVHIFTSDRAFDFFAPKYKNVHRVKGFHLVYEENRLNSRKSVLWNIRHLPEGFMPAIRTVARMFEQLKPNVIVSDFEFFTAFFGRAGGIPVIAANNISIVGKTRVAMPARKLRRAKRMAVTTSQLLTFKPTWYVIPTFFSPRVKGKNVILTAPVVRDKIVKAKPTWGKHILVYQTSPTCLKLLHNLKSTKEKFVVYGFGARPREGNLKFCPFNDTTFIKDLASAKAVITGGGFSLISEALYLKKPILSVPLRDHFEQITNGYYLRELRYGDYNIEPTPQDVEAFLAKLSVYKESLRHYHFHPAEFARTIEALCHRVAKEPKERRLRRLARLIREL